MTKKIIALCLVLLTALGCFAFAAAAEDDPAEPETTMSGYYVGQILPVGFELKSAAEKCDKLNVTYCIAAADVENVTSALQADFGDPEFKSVTSFRDSIAGFTNPEGYAGVYPVKGPGDTVNEMEVAYRVYKTGDEIKQGIDKEDWKLYGIAKKDLVLTIDYDYAHTTRNQYTSITGWEIATVEDTENELSVRLQAVFETREPNSWESFQETVHTYWMKLLDKLGDVLIRLVPDVIARWADLLQGIFGGADD